MGEALLEHLALVEEHIQQGERHIQRQRELLAELERDGHDAAAARARSLLQVFEQSQLVHLAELERLRHQITTGIAQCVP